ncbi:PQ loop repeat-domain-containing protein [Mycotypha africana]|uniref:PQ loop repeat-domain-containing protein n=1 Tax=Mycotypha africana TaxID=64632 RepID=UPI002301D91F|nr:PQ loop repeat-domain-containing protein [Mycotypha africana]KAI8979397.1 PQ loop repeat-domain-containing protein [Mycotypha africana]
MQTTCPILNDGSTAISWIYTLFGDCVYGWHDSLSLLLGYLSIFCWLNAQMPQVIKNYRIRDAEGLSFEFLTVWLVGDVANFIGCIITGQLLFQTILSVYFIIIDTVLCLQWLYYVKYADNRLRRWIDGDDGIKRTNTKDATRQLEQQHERADSTNITAAGTNPKLMNEQSSLLASSPQHKKYATMMLVFCFYSTFALSSPTSNLIADNNNTIWVGRFFAWLCTFLYLSSRLPQIYRNFRRRSVEGLSMALFFFAAMGNLTYVLSIFTNPHATRATLLEAVPYIIGSAGTLMFDFTIFTQYALYSRKVQTTDRLLQV